MLLRHYFSHSRSFACKRWTCHPRVCQLMFVPRLCTRATVDMRRQFTVGANVDKEGHACCDVKLDGGFIHIFSSSPNWDWDDWVPRMTWFQGWIHNRNGPSLLIKMMKSPLLWVISCKIYKSEAVMTFPCWVLRPGQVVQTPASAHPDLRHGCCPIAMISHDIPWYPMILPWHSHLSGFFATTAQSLLANIPIYTGSAVLMMSRWRRCPHLPSSL